MRIDKLFTLMPLLAWFSLVATLGDDSFVCHPCARSNCYLSDSSKTISVSVLGPVTCGEIQAGADADLFNPKECSLIQQVTLGTSDPCDCRAEGGEDCPPPGFTQDQACNLCGSVSSSGMRIGDPHMVIKSGILNGIECITAFDDNAYGAFSSPTVCPLVQALFAEYCSCIPFGKAIKECIQQEDDVHGCDPNDPTDVCCEGFCRYRSTHGRHVCTFKPETPVPPSFVAPSPSPGPIDVPTAFNTLPGVFECDPTVGCGNDLLLICAFVGGADASYKCINRSATSKVRPSIASGRGGSGGGKR